MSSSITIKLNKKLAINVLLFLAAVLALALLIELGIIAYSLKAGIFCQ